VGTITSVALSPLDQAPIALALIRTSHAQPGTHLTAEPAEGAVSLATTVSDLPLCRYL
jgi:glycine cleavage system aminomethyltransferase T